jgi:hypothetical protein
VNRARGQADPSGALDDRAGRRVFLCVFEAASEDIVREAYVRAGLSFERISTAISEED